MGSYSSCHLGPLYLGSVKSSVDYNLIGLFRQSDKKVVPIGSISEPINKHVLQYADEEDLEGNLVYYSTDVGTLRDRLDLTGYRIDVAKHLFREAISQEIDFLKECSSGSDANDYYQGQIEKLEALTPEVWCIRIRQRYELVKSKLEVGESVHYHEYADDNGQDNEGWFGYPGEDICVAVRILLEDIPATDAFIIDVTDLIMSEYFEEDFDFVQDALNLFSYQYSRHCKTIVLTEGKFDTYVFKQSMRILYPHLCDYFSFIDFDEYRVPGGAGNLANFVKLISGSGIANKVIAVFDNDTAGMAAKASLQDVNVPDNITTMLLPNIDLFENYPSIGPEGLASLNVNGRAAGIELYLGRDVLRQPDGKLYPVQWTGYDGKMKSYQGEVIGKNDIQKRFQEKIEIALRDPSNHNGDWNDLRSVLTKMFDAFRETDEATLLREINNEI